MKRRRRRSRAPLQLSITATTVEYLQLSCQQREAAVLLCAQSSYLTDLRLLNIQMGRDPATVTRLPLWGLSTQMFLRNFGFWFTQLQCGRKVDRP